MIVEESKDTLRVKGREIEKLSRLTFSKYQLITIENNQSNLTDGNLQGESNPIIAQFRIERSMRYIDSLSESSEISLPNDAPNKDPHYSVLY